MHRWFDRWYWQPRWCEALKKSNVQFRQQSWLYWSSHNHASHRAGSRPGSDEGKRAELWDNFQCRCISHAGLRYFFYGCASILMDLPMWWYGLPARCWSCRSGRLMSLIFHHQQDRWRAPFPCWCWQVPSQHPGSSVHLAVAKWMWWFGWRRSKSHAVYKCWHGILTLPQWQKKSRRHRLSQIGKYRGGQQVHKSLWQSRGTYPVSCVLPDKYASFRLLCRSADGLRQQRYRMHALLWYFLKFLWRSYS